MNTFEYVTSLCEAAKVARAGFEVSGAKKNEVLLQIASAICERAEEIVSANRIDLSLAKVNGVPDPMVDRLMLNVSRIEGIAESLRELVRLEDPVGKGIRTVRPNGLIIEHIRVPLGVIAVIYESRPNVTVDIAAICIKTGNACVLRGGKEAINTNRVLVSVMRDSLAECGLPQDLVSLVDDVTRESSAALMKMRGLVDLLIPRGNKGLINSVVENSIVPVIETGAGNCHLYVDEYAELEMAVNVAVNAKMSRPSVCNAIETLLVHESVANEFLPMFMKGLGGKPLDIRGCETTCAILGCAAASEEDWETEYDDFILAVKVVTGIDEAINHINKYGTKHSDCIITRDMKNAELFRLMIDSAAVYVNASTRFTDGGEFGFGAEVGISTQKLHARGPMGLDALTTEKYLITGEGQIR